MSNALLRNISRETIMCRMNGGKPIGICLARTNIARRSSRLGLAVLLAALLGQLLAPPARAGNYDVGEIHIADTWARATPKGASSGAGYMTVTNNGTAPDRLSCLSSAASAKCQIHSMTMENGVMNAIIGD
jgi:periplasmic copper chaperone A